jgi:hypothetical protein
MEKEAKRIAKKYFNANIKVTFEPCFDERARTPLRGKCIIPLNKIEFDVDLFSGKGEFPPHAFFTIVHEVCHLKWLHGEPEFKRIVFSILAKERRNKKKFEEEVSIILSK